MSRQNSFNILYIKSTTQRAIFKVQHLDTVWSKEKLIWYSQAEQLRNVKSSFFCNGVIVLLQEQTSLHTQWTLQAAHSRLDQEPWCQAVSLALPSVVACKAQTVHVYSEPRLWWSHVTQHLSFLPETPQICGASDCDLTLVTISSETFTYMPIFSWTPTDLRWVWDPQFKELDPRRTKSYLPTEPPPLPTAHSGEPLLILMLTPAG